MKKDCSVTVVTAQDRYTVNDGQSACGLRKSGSKPDKFIVDIKGEFTHLEYARLLSWLNMIV